MTDRYERIRAALAMGPTSGPWGLKELPRDMQRDGYKFAISRSGLGWWIAKVTHEANGGTGAANAAHIAACDPDTIRELLDERDALAAEVERLRRGAHPAITHCDNCGCDWLDNGLNPVGCPYCELRRETERRWEGNRRSAHEYVEDMRDVLREAAQICKDLDEEALSKEGRLACGAECAGAIADLAVRWNVPFERAESLSKENSNG